VCQRLDVSQRRACQVLSQPRATQRYPPPRVDQDRALAAAVRRLAGLHPRYGYRRITALLKAEGWTVNRKWVYRLWRQESLQVPEKKGKRKRLGDSQNSCLRRRAEHINHVWSYDFVTDQTQEGRRLKLLVILDEYTRESLAIEVARRIQSQEVIAALAYLFAVRGAPQYLRSDNGPEFVAAAVLHWLREAGVSTLYIAPGSPWENAYIESFNSRLRDELLNVESFGNLREAQVLVEEYRRQYNHHRPHSASNYMTPAAFAAACLASAPASAGPTPTPNRQEVVVNSQLGAGT
jgi:putative transposase